MKERIQFHRHEFQEKSDEKRINLMMVRVILIEQDFLVQHELMLMNEDEKIRINIFLSPQLETFEPCSYYLSSVKIIRAQKKNCVVVFNHEM